MASMDFLLQEEQSLEKIKQVVAECLGVSLLAVTVIQDVSDYPSAGTYYAVCKVSALPRGMKQLVTVDWAGVEISSGLIECFANRFGISCLVPTTDPNPYKMELVSPGGVRKQVSIDVQLLDDNGVYQIVEKEKGSG
jgi:hypothetical protein